MKLPKAHQRTATEARGITIVIDVIRAFSVAGYAFEQGVRSTWREKIVRKNAWLFGRQQVNSLTVSKPFIVVSRTKMIVETYTGGEFYAKSTLPCCASGKQWQNSSAKHQRSVDLAYSMVVMLGLKPVRVTFFTSKFPHYVQTFLKNALFFQHLRVLVLNNFLIAPSISYGLRITCRRHTL